MVVIMDRKKNITPLDIRIGGQYFQKGIVTQSKNKEEEKIGPLLHVTFPIWTRQHLSDGET